jgi:hypothetical protein
MKKRLFLLVFFIKIGSFVSFGQVSATIFRPATVEFTLRDFWNLAIQNTADSVTVFLHGTAIETTDGPLLDINSAKFSLQKGLTNFNTANFDVLLPENVLFKNEKYREIIVRTNELPAGDYEMCVEIIEIAQNSVLAKTCLDFSVRQLTPPILLFPAPEDSICEPLPFFIWTPPQPVRPGEMANYQLKISEIQGFQTPESALFLNPAWHISTGIFTPVFQYPVEARPFEFGRQYAWQIIANDPIGQPVTSEIFAFFYKNCGQIGAFLTENDPNKAKKRKNPKITGFRYFDLNNHETGQSTALTQKDLNYLLINKNQFSKCFFKLIEPTGKPISSGEIELDDGYNFISLPNENLKLQPNQIYRLEVREADGQLWNLHFLTKKG